MKDAETLAYGFTFAAPKHLAAKFENEVEGPDAGKMLWMIILAKITAKQKGQRYNSSSTAEDLGMKSNAAGMSQDELISINGICFE